MKSAFCSGCYTAGRAMCFAFFCCWSALKDAAYLLQALSSLGYIPDDVWLCEFFSQSKRSLPKLSPKSLTGILASLAALGRRPDDLWLRAWFTAMRPASLRQQLPVPWWPRLLKAFAALAIRPDGAWLRDCYGACAAVLPVMRADQLLAAAEGARDMGMQPPEAWVSAWTTHAFGKLEYAAGVEELAGMGRVAAGLRAGVSKVWLCQWELQVQQRLQCCEGIGLGQVMITTVLLRHKPSPAFMEVFAAASHDKLGEFPPEGLACAAKVMADMRWQPGLSWLYGFVSVAYGRLEVFSGQQLTVLFEALPTLAPSPRWVDDLVQICSFEASLQQQGLAAAGGMWGMGEEGNRQVGRGQLSQKREQPQLRGQQQGWEVQEQQLGEQGGHLLEQLEVVAGGRG